MSSKNKLFKDLQSGFLVFLIALPLCIGISLASGYPAVAGLLAAIVGGFIVPLLSNSELTIKGPAAGLIVIALGCVTEFGFTGMDVGRDFLAYRGALAVGVASSVFQILFGALKWASLVEFFPVAVVHGMLAAIGVIIFAKQLPILLGISSKGEPLDLLLEIPNTILKMNPEVALIGGVSLVVLMALLLAKNPRLKRVPAALVAVLVAVPLGRYFNLEHEHTYTLLGQNYQVGEKFLVSVPGHLWNAITFPDFSVLAEWKTWKWVTMFALIGSLESTLSAKAVDLLDPKKRKTNLNRDLLAVGVANLGASLIGGLPMISEIVRSRANIDAGAQTRKSLFFHSFFLVVFVLFLPGLIRQIPLAALAALLVVTGYRLASPREFKQVLQTGPEQLFVYLGTIVTILATDLLVGLAVGVFLELCVLKCLGAPLRYLFCSSLRMENSSKRICFYPQEAAVFIHWPGLRRRIYEAGARYPLVLVDFSEVHLIDHTLMLRIAALSHESRADGFELQIKGLEGHRTFSSHPHAGRKRKRSKNRRNSP